MLSSPLIKCLERSAPVLEYLLVHNIEPRALEPTSSIPPLQVNFASHYFLHLLSSFASQILPLCLLLLKYLLHNLFFINNLNEHFTLKTQKALSNNFIKTLNRSHKTLLANTSTHQLPFNISPFNLLFLLLNFFTLTTLSMPINSLASTSLKYVHFPS